MELVSVIVPVYNVREYLDKCIKSIVNQTYYNIEIIIVDDGSTDGSKEKCDFWEERDDRINVIHKKNGGLSDARNCGMKKASGFYICFIDSDDWIDSDWIEKLVSAIEEGNSDIAASATRIFGEDNKTIYIRGKINREFNSKEALKELIEEKNLFNTACDKLYKRELACSNYFELGKTNEDEFWSWKIISNAKKIVCVDTTYYNYYQRENSIMGEKYSNKRLDGLQARYERKKELSKNNELRDICNIKFVGDCMYHLQMILKYLYHNERNKTIKIVKKYLTDIKGNNIKRMNLSYIQYLWLRVFLICPITVCKLRNKLKIGF